MLPSTAIPALKTHLVLGRLGVDVHLEELNPNKNEMLVHIELRKRSIAGVNLTNKNRAFTYATLATGGVGDVDESALVGIALLGTTYS